MIAYPATIKYSRSDKCFLVCFKDLPGCLTYGGTLEEAKENAREALTGYLESIDLRKLQIPKPSTNSGKTIFYIVPDKQVAFAIWLKQKRQSRGLTQKAMSEMLDVRIQSYQKLENPRKTNPTLKTIKKVEEILKEQVLYV